MYLISNCVAYGEDEPYPNEIIAGKDDNGNLYIVRDQYCYPSTFPLELYATNQFKNWIRSSSAESFKWNEVELTYLDEDISQVEYNGILMSAENARFLDVDLRIISETQLDDESKETTVGVFIVDTDIMIFNLVFIVTTNEIELDSPAEFEKDIFI